jgi:hypothetical protein
LEILEDILKGRIIGKKIVHNWSEEDQDGSLVVSQYNGKVEKVVKPKEKRRQQKNLREKSKAPPAYSVIVCVLLGTRRKL